MFEDINRNDKSLINFQDRIKNQDNKALFDNRIDLNEPLLNKRELALLLNVSVRTLDKWVLFKKIPFIKVGRLVKFQRKVVEKWLDERNHHYGN